MKILRLKYDSQSTFEKACKKYGWIMDSGIHEDSDIVVVLLPQEDITPENERVYDENGFRVPDFAEYILVNVLCKNNNIPKSLMDEDITGHINSPMHVFLGISS